MWLESFGQELISNNSGLRESVHASADLDVDVAIEGNVLEFVGINDLLWQNGRVEVWLHLQRY
jgi:hypothetical protein